MSYTPSSKTVHFRAIASRTLIGNPILEVEPTPQRGPYSHRKRAGQIVSLPSVRYLVRVGFRYEAGGQMSCSGQVRSSRAGLMSMRGPDVGGAASNISPPGRWT